MIKKIVISTVFIINSFVAVSQDFQFSHYMQSPALVNPSLIATTSNLDFNFLFRSQWSAIVDPYGSYQFLANYPMLYSNNQRWGAVGLSAISNHSGENGLFKSTKVSGIFAYNLRLGNDYNIAFGLQPSMIFRKIDEGRLITGSQWNGSAYDPNIPIGENFDQTQTSFFEITSSALWYQEDDNGMDKFFGVTVSNLNQPKESFLDNNSTLPMRISFIGGMDVYESQRVTISPRAYFTQQAKAVDFIGGGLVTYSIFDQQRNTGEAKAKVGAGLYYRFGDAVILATEFSKDRFKVGLSHDFNASSLSKDLKLTGATEIYLTYSIPIEREYKPRKIKPRFDNLNTKRPDKTKSGKEGNKEEGTLNTKVIIKTSDADSKKSIKPHVDFAPSDVKGFEIFSVDSSNNIDDALIVTMPQMTKLDIVLIKSGYDNQEHTIKTLTQDTLWLDIAMQKMSEKEKVDFGNIQFAEKSFELDSTSFPVLDRIAQYLIDNPIIQVEVAGHSYDEGSDTFNERLSKLRAESVVLYLVEKGIPEERLTTKGYGEKKPLDKDSPNKNRRVEIYLE